jgi:hypothetical protein
MSDMNNDNIAFYAISISPQSTSHLTLPYRDRNKTFAKGRVLVVALPSLPPVRDNYSGAFTYKKQAEEIAAATPTDLELCQAHHLGLHLLNAAMTGNLKSINDIWVEDHATGRQIAMPHIYLLKKVTDGSWTPGYYKIHPGGFYDVSKKPDLQQAANALCDSIAIACLDLSQIQICDALPVFPSTKIRKAAYRTIARQLRKSNWEPEKIYA